MIKSSSISCSYTTLNILQIKILLSFAKVNYYFSSQLDVALRLSIVNLPNYSILGLTFHIKPLIIFLKMFEIHFSISLRQRTFNLFCANCLRILLINIGLRYQHEGIWNTQLEWIFFFSCLWRRFSCLLWATACRYSVTKYYYEKREFLSVLVFLKKGRTKEFSHHKGNGNLSLHFSSASFKVECNICCCFMSKSRFQIDD
jgi:hypothetical protein